MDTALSEYVKKTMIGYKEVPGGASDPECSHVVLTKIEYDQLCQEKARAEVASCNIKYEAEQNIKRVRDDAQYRVHQAEAEAQKKIATVEQELVKAQREIVYQRGLNKNLLRISKERANAERKLKPKKLHTGYVIVSTGEKDYSYKKDRKQWGRARLWETILQSPYSVDFTEEQARKQIREDLFGEGENSSWLISGLDITAAFGGRYEDLIELEAWATKYNMQNIALKPELKLKAGFRSGYSEASFLHTKALGVVPADMRLR